MAPFLRSMSFVVFALSGLVLPSSAVDDLVPDEDKIDCYPEIGNQTLCLSRGCIWKEKNTKVGSSRAGRFHSIFCNSH